MDDPALQRIGEMVGLGLLPRDAANHCLKVWQMSLKAGRPVALTDLFVQAKLLTKTQGAVVARESLTRTQPFRNYRLLKQAGQGGMAIVFEAAYLGLKPPVRVALKVLDARFCLRDADRLRFKREAGILLALDHDSIVEGREYFTEDGVDAYAMAYVDGISMLDLLDRGVRLPEPLCLHVVAQVASALEHMWQKGIVHRDVKPANLVLDHAGRVRIIDFGLAKVMRGMRQDTGEDTTVGTPEYMSPEQARGQADVDTRSDVYALGCTLFHMVTGELPFKGSPAEVIYAQVKTAVEFTPAQRARISPPVQYVLRRMMAKAPEDRYPSGQALLDELKALCGPILAQPLVVPAEVSDAAFEAAPIPQKPPPQAPVLRRPEERRRPHGRGGHRR